MNAAFRRHCSWSKGAAGDEKEEKQWYKNIHIYIYMILNDVDTGPTRGLSDRRFKPNCCRRCPHLAQPLNMYMYTHTEFGSIQEGLLAFFPPTCHNSALFAGAKSSETLGGAGLGRARLIGQRLRATRDWMQQIPTLTSKSVLQARKQSRAIQLFQKPQVLVAFSVSTR